MRLTAITFLTAIILVGGVSAVSAQVGQDLKRQAETQTASQREIWVYLVAGPRLQADEVTESDEGIWYKRGNVSTFIDKARVKWVERVVLRSDVKPAPSAETVQNAGNWTIGDSSRVESFFMARFSRPLPLTAFGQSDLHTRWGLDHRQGMDVGLHPDSPEGRALIAFLRREGIPFLAFRSAIPGVATGPHIHIGNGSHRLPGR